MVRVLAVSVVLVLAAGSGAQGAWNVGGSFGALSTGETIGQGEISVIAGLGYGDALTAFGMGRYGVANGIDGRLKLGMRDAGGTNAEFIVGLDAMYQVLSRDVLGGDPLDLSFGGMIEWWHSEAQDTRQIGGFAVGSYPFRLGNGMLLAPYGRLNARVEGISPEGQGEDTSELELGFNAGARLDVARHFRVYGEVQIDGNDGVFAGAEFFID